MATACGREGMPGGLTMQRGCLARLQNPQLAQSLSAPRPVSATITIFLSGHCWRMRRQAS